MNEHLRVLFISSGNITNCGVNGVTTQVLGPGEALKKIGVELDYFLIRGKGLKGYLGNVKTLRAWLKEHKHYDILHAHNGLSGIITFLAAPSAAIVVSYMGSDLLGGVDRHGKPKLQGKILAVIHRILSQIVYKYSIVKSKNLFERLWESTKKQIIPNGVDFTVFHPVPKSEAREKLGLPIDKIIIIFAADPKTTEKNYALAVESVRQLHNDNVELVSVVGHPQATLNYYYNACDILLLTSFHEGSPNVIKESLATNCAIVSTKVGDVPEVVSGIDNCFVCDFDPQIIRDKLQYLIDHGCPKSNGREKINWLKDTTIAGKIQHIYQMVLGNA
ncbi:MAG: glycosyltransferase family 4 protein [Ignavibacteria bacterium]|nr:glycosyltransferase family 4 protein [Ignavibacteria bacterium]